jgi:colicin import membrane protein
VSESKELVLVQLPAPADLEAAFISDEYISNLIADIRQKALSVVGDVNTVKGRGVYISMASTVRRTKTAIDEAGKNLVAEMKKRPALVDASRTWYSLKIIPRSFMLQPSYYSSAQQCAEPLIGF